MTVVAHYEGEGALRALVESVLAPLVARDGGELHWVRRVGDVVEVAMLGQCRGCPAQRDTLDGVLLPALRGVDPTVAAVRAVPRPSV